MQSSGSWNMPLGTYVSWLCEASRSTRLWEGGGTEEGGGREEGEGREEGGGKERDRRRESITIVAEIRFTSSF